MDMHRSLSGALLAALLTVLAPVTSFAGADGSLDHARELIDRDDAAGAVQVLEDRLSRCPSAERPIVIDLLRKAYETAARQADAAGRGQEADDYRDNLEILNRKPLAKPAAPAIDVAVRRTSAALEEPRSEPPPAKPASLIPLPASDHGSPGSHPQASPDETPVAPKSPKAAVAPHPQVAAGPNGQSAQSRLGSADSAFKAGRFEDAGRIYAALARSRQLPASYVEKWAYCRCFVVTNRINARPKTAQEWAEIKAEIASIQTLSPKFWTAEYLRNKVEEISSRKQTARLKKIVVRGAAPEERSPVVLPATERAEVRPTKDRDPIVLADNAPLPAAPPAADPAPKKFGNWLVMETKNFRILHADQGLAEKTARAAELAREQQFKRWMGASPSETWSPRCDIYLYPTGKIFSQMTGQPEESPGFSTMGMNGGRIIARRVNLRADHVNLVAAILPHEVTHVVLADLFPQQQIPRWADEGMAVLSEPSSEQRTRAADLDEPLSSGELFKVQDLMVMDYPDGKHWALYYAQSVSLTRFLVEQGTPVQFVEFVQGSQRRDHQSELRRIYKIDGFEDLQKRWVSYARTKSSATGTLAKEPAKDSGTVRR